MKATKLLADNKYLIFKELKSIALIILAVLAFKDIFIANYTVPTGSMEPIIQPDDKLLVNKMAFNLRIPFTDIVLYEFDSPKRGNIVVFDWPVDPSLNFVKRIVGLPGDLVEVSDGFITVNGNPIETSLNNEDEIINININGGLYEEKLPDVTYSIQRKPHIPLDTSRKWQVPKGHYFVMGDNRDNSDDSRRWGFVPMKNIKGKTLFIYFSLDWKNDSWLPKVRTERIGMTL